MNLNFGLKPHKPTRKINFANKETIRLHMHHIGKRWKLSKWVPHDLTSKNRLQRLTICSSHLTRLKMEPFFDRILTCDEKWVMCINTKRTHHWLSPKDPLPQIPKARLSARSFYCVFGGYVKESFITHF